MPLLPPLKPHLPTWLPTGLRTSLRLREVLSVEPGLIGSASLGYRIPEILLPLSALRGHSEKLSVCKPGRELPPATKGVCTLALDFPAPRNRRNSFLRFESLRLWYEVRHPPNTGRALQNARKSSAGSQKWLRNLSRIPSNLPVLSATAGLAWRRAAQEPEGGQAPRTWRRGLSCLLVPPAPSTDKA